MPPGTAIGALHHSAFASLGGSLDTTATARRNRKASRAALCLVLATATPALATPGAPDITFGPRGMRIDPTMLQGLGEDGTGFGQLTALTGNRIAATTGLRCGMDCRSTVIARYLSTGSPDLSLIHISEPTRPY